MNKKIITIIIIILKFTIKNFKWVFCDFKSQGDDMREDNSPSWFNPEETVQVVYYLQGLLGNKPPVHPDNIGIITPYRKQVRNVR